MKKPIIIASAAVFTLALAAGGFWVYQQKNADPNQLPSVEQIVLNKKFPSLAKALPAALQPQVTAFASIVQHADTLKTEGQMLNLLKMRDDLMPIVNEKVCAYFDSNSDKSKNIERIEKELNALGMQIEASEGSCVGVKKSPLLKTRSMALLSEPVRLAMDLEQEHINSLMGEYHLQDLTSKMKVLALGEQLRSKYPESPYIASTKVAFDEALETLTDVHIGKHDNQDEAFVGGINGDTYSNGTSIDQYTTFIKKYPQSRYAKVVKSILTNISTVEMGENGFEHLFAVVTDEVANEVDASQMVLNYLNSGKDIPHTIRTQSKTYIVYRFYSDKEKAEAALQRAQKMKATAKVVEIDLTTLIREN